MTDPQKRSRAPKLSSQEREQMILRNAIDYFAKEGFGAGTRDLANHLGITQSLLYRYFPSKQSLIERVYEEVTLSRWNPLWEDLIRDRSKPLADRLHEYYLDYAKLVLRNEWVRILIFAGIESSGINNRLFGLLRNRIFIPVVRECYAEFAGEKYANVPVEEIEMELELVWALHASIFYIGMRKWIYGTTMPKNVDATIDALVVSFLAGMKQHIGSKVKPPRERRSATLEDAHEIRNV
ncbi:Bacterial regulatory proteins, tetR family [Variovorax sp. PBL-H6]|uniref:TetR/AcrR family transcriptional regulator n=1 Tax=Variovorax sp. PBL-H6 TaxID=434009 RepID=UPI001318A67C|nr:TetR/AcrR family transcriptional regulator [Variovorax sp. PBL-H6]VTU15101.1 Bacterial regulatory proteins, tetR family [Variovorax sp. PBL-H6]